MKEQNHLSATIDNVLLILSAESYTPPEIGKALAGLQLSADSTSDLGLAAIVIGLSQTKALVRLCRDYVNSKESELAFLEDVSKSCEVIGGLVIPSEDRRTGWSLLSVPLHEALEAVATATTKAGTEAAKVILQQTRKTLSEFATSICKSYLRYTVLGWMDELITAWDTETAFRPIPESTFRQDFAGYKFLAPAAANMIRMTFEAESTLHSVLMAWKASKAEGGLSVESAVKLARQFHSFSNGSGNQLASQDIIGADFGAALGVSSKNIVAFSDARVALRLKDCSTSIGDLMAKARCVVGDKA